MSAVKLLSRRCNYHSCKECSGWSTTIAAFIIGLAVEPPLVMWSSGKLHPLFDWLPHFEYTQALALSILVAFVMQVRVKGVLAR